MRLARAARAAPPDLTAEASGGRGAVMLVTLEAGFDARGRAARGVERARRRPRPASRRSRRHGHVTVLGAARLPLALDAGREGGDPAYRRNRGRARPRRRHPARAFPEARPGARGGGRRGAAEPRGRRAVAHPRQATSARCRAPGLRALVPRLDRRGPAALRDLATASSPARTPAAISASCSRSTVSGGPIATPLDCTRSSTPALRIAAVNVPSARGSAASTSGIEIDRRGASPRPPRISPAAGCSASGASAAIRSPSSSCPRGISSSRSRMSRFASAAAQHVGCPEYVAPCLNTARPGSLQNGAATSALTSTPPSGR